MSKIFDFFLYLIFPCNCVSCGDPVSASMDNLCVKCRDSMRILDDGCPVCCGSVNQGECSICGNRKFYPSAHISLFSYENVSRAVIHSLKFGGMKHLYRVFIPYICEKISGFDDKIDIITSVPMNRKKLIKRGYNQSKLLAQGVSRVTGLKYADILKESRNFIKQRELNYSGRFINVIDRYETVNNNKFRGKTVLLIDDVFTTGATINECSRKLVCSGAARVFSITVVRSDLKKLENV